MVFAYDINCYIDEFKELAYKFRITTKNQFEQDKIGFQKLPVVLN